MINILAITLLSRIGSPLLTFNEDMVIYFTFSGDSTFQSDHYMVIALKSNLYFPDNLSQDKYPILLLFAFKNTFHL